MNLLLPGMYVAADSALHRLDPRVKMGAALWLMTIPFAAHHLRSSLLLSAFVATIALLSDAPLLALLRTLRTIFWVGFFQGTGAGSPRTNSKSSGRWSLRPGFSRTARR